MKKLLYGIVFLSSFILLLPAGVKAEKLTLVYESYPPYEYLDGERMDVAILNELVYNSLVKKMGMKGKLEVVYQQSLDPLFIAFSKAKEEKAKKLAADFGKVLAEMRKKGDI